MNIGIILQARTGSSRFPAKVLAPFYKDKNVLEFLINRIHQSKHHLPVILATTRSPNDDLLVPYALQQDVALFRGPEADVLTRFLQAAETYGLDTVVRVCSDNPLIDISLMDILIDDAIAQQDYDYYSYYVNKKPVILSHFGIFCEIASCRALKKVAENYGDEYKEHVTNGLYTHESDFKIYKKDYTEQLMPYDGIRLTVDTRDDLENVKNVAGKHGAPLDTLHSLFPLIIRNKSMLENMRKIIRTQQK
jgi:spore coat polysaccharide biosynthesis protein SpsF